MSFPACTNCRVAAGPTSRAIAGVMMVGLVAVAAGCGKKGPPLPPLRPLPAAPTAVAVEASGETVTVVFALPTANADGTTPVDLAAVDVYALVADAATAADEIVRRGRVVASVASGAAGSGATSADATPAAAAAGAITVSATVPAQPGAWRGLVLAGRTRRGRRGPLSAARWLPAAADPIAPTDVHVAYDETALTVTWAAGGSPAGVTEDARYEDARYVVERRRAPSDPVQASEPLTARTYSESPLWGAAVCYTVRAVRLPSPGVRVSSAPSDTQCLTAIDTFAPASPDGLTAVAADGTVSLIWNASPSPDVVGYRVLRATAPSLTFEPVTTVSVPETTFHEARPVGTTVSYRVEAVDAAGNRSAPTPAVTDVVR